MRRTGLKHRLTRTSNGLTSHAVTNVRRQHLTLLILEDRLLFSVVVTPTADSDQIAFDLESLPTPCASAEWNTDDSSGVVIEPSAPAANLRPTDSGQIARAQFRTVEVGEQHDVCRTADEDLQSHPDPLKAFSQDAIDAATTSREALDLESSRLDSSEEPFFNEPQPDHTRLTLAATVEQLRPARESNLSNGASEDQPGAASLVDSRPRMLDIGRAVSPSAYGGWGITARRPPSIMAPEPAVGHRAPTPDGPHEGPGSNRGVDTYFQRLGKLPLHDTREQHAAARDDVNLFVLGRNSSLPPDWRNHRWMETADDQESAVEGADIGPIMEAEFELFPARLFAFLLPPSAVTPQPNRSDVPALASDVPVPPAAATVDEPVAEPLLASDALVAAELKTWTMEAFVPGWLMRAACAVACASGLIVRRRKANGGPSPTSAPDCSAIGRAAVAYPADSALSPRYSRHAGERVRMNRPID